MTVPIVRKRAKRPKTRTGCRTCRARHIKCDEAKPTCRRCAVSGRHCDGYEAGVTSAKGVFKALSVLLPLDLAWNDARALDWSLHLTPVCLTGREAQALDFFRIYTISRLPEGPWASFWAQLALQIACQEPAIVHAMVAVGSIHQYFNQSREARTTLCVNVSSDQHSFAICHYNQAMSYMRNCVEGMTHGTSSNNSVEMVLVACLLFSSFEMLEGSDRAAMTHLRLGLRILYEKMRMQKSHGQSTQKRVVPMKALPESSLDRLLHTFVRLDYDLTLFGETEPYLLPECSSTLPPSFTTLYEARVHLDVLTSAFLHVKGVLLKLAENAIDNNANLTVENDDDARSSLTHAMSRRVALDSHPDTMAQLQHAQNGLNRWLAAMASFPVPVEEEVLRTHLMLQIEFFHTWFVASTTQDRIESLCDRFKDSYTYIVDLAEQYLQLTRQLSADLHTPDQFSIQLKHVFTLGTGIVPYLHTVAVKCRTSSVRKRAQALIAQTNTIGMSDSTIVAAFTKRIIQLEEERARLIGGYPADYDCFESHEVPEQARLLDVTMSTATVSPDTGRLVCSVWSDSSCSQLSLLDDYFSIPEMAGWTDAQEEEASA